MDTGHQATDNLLRDENLTYDVLRAILDHKYFKTLDNYRIESERRKAERDNSEVVSEDVSMSEAMCSFYHNVEPEWRQQKTLEGNLAQIDEMDKHAWIESEKQKMDIGNKARQEWLENNPQNWRESIQTPEYNHIMVLDDIVVQNKYGIHLRPSGDLAKALLKFDCDILACNTRFMKNYDCTVLGNKFLHMQRYNLIECARNFSILGAAMGDKLIFLLYCMPNNQDNGPSESEKAAAKMREMLPEFCKYEKIA